MELGIADAGCVSQARAAAADVGVAGDVLERLTHRLELAEGTVSSSRAEWAELVAVSQRVVNTATALQNLAITRLAAIEDDLLDDGSVVESPRVPGHVALDAPDVVAGALGVSHTHAEQRVSLAVRLTVPDDEQAGMGAGLGGLHAAMADGVLDGYRASVVADELAEAPPEVAAAVVHVLVPYLGVEPPAALRNRCRRAIARISPDLLVQRAKRARERCGLRRWVEEPGVDRWDGTFPSERAAEGWAAVDGLAQRYVAQGRCATIEAARGEALMDLIRGQATVDVQLVVTVPAEAVDDGVETVTASAAAAPSSAHDAGQPQRHGKVQEAMRDVIRTTKGRSDRADPSDAEGQVTPDAAEVDADAPAQVDAADAMDNAATPADGMGIVTGPAGGDDGVDLAGSADGLGAGASSGGSASGPAGESSAASRAVAARGDAVPVGRDGDLVEVTGPFPGGPVLVERRWVMALLHSAGRPPADRARGPLGAPRVDLRVEMCDAHTGALLGAGAPGGRAYRPSRRVVALVRARDGRCRFPGCSVAARFCDLDHVRPWPGGATAPPNLMCLCRRHHRIKQRHNWSVRLLPDGRAVWTDPTGRVRTSWPRDLLTPVVLSGSAAAPPPSGCSTAAPADSTSRTTPTAWSIWGTMLEVRVEHLPPTPEGVVREACRSDPSHSVSARRAGPCWWWPSRHALRYVDDPRGHAGGTTRVRRRSKAPPAADLDPPPF